MTTSLNTIHPTAIIDDGASLGKNVHIGPPFVTIAAGAKLGDNVVVENGAIIHENVELGEGCRRLRMI
ncbi:MAG: hypothetical protein R3F51_26220 [Cyanobacteriota/Melainabacteria group bacterium]